ncbi:MAG TPA: sulfite exporter TauE/SafE family protein [Solirubrobacteraceae bacterium]|nr:sulfite exporter TauE/SafE family protein [Solirubrobacteraceae bacterium]
MAERRTLKLALIGSAAGLFSGIFGVGGGSVIVPALVLSLGYNQREAAGTSLLAITMIAAFAAALQAGYGNVHVLDGVLIGVPAIVGVLIGARVARVVPHRTLALVFSAVLLAASVELILE